MAQTFYPAYIPEKWIHYTRHKKKKIRKKYQNRIRREVRRHNVDAQTLSFLLADAATKYSGRIGYSQPELSKRLAALDAGERCDCESSQRDERRQQDDETEARAKQNSDLPAMR